MKSTFLLALAIWAVTPGIALADVTDSSPGGFTVKIAIGIQASPGEVYRRLIRVGDWWDSSHTFSGDAHNMSIEEKPMGCFCERLPGGGAARHMEVVRFEPGKTLVMLGGLGPLQSLATAGSMTIQLAADGGATKLVVSYAVAGYLPGGMYALAAPVDGVLTQQFVRLKNYVERGDPVSPSF